MVKKRSWNLAIANPRRSVSFAICSLSIVFLHELSAAETSKFDAITTVNVRNGESFSVPSGYLRRVPRQLNLENADGFEFFFWHPDGDAPESVVTMIKPRPRESRHKDPKHSDFVVDIAIISPDLPGGHRYNAEWVKQGVGENKISTIHLNNGQILNEWHGLLYGSQLYYGKLDSGAEYKMNCNPIPARWPNPLCTGYAIIGDLRENAWIQFPDTGDPIDVAQVISEAEGLLKGWHVERPQAP